jgi:uncharacterized protein YxjI
MNKQRGRLLQPVEARGSENLKLEKEIRLPKNTYDSDTLGDEVSETVKQSLMIFLRSKSEKPVIEQKIDINLLSPEKLSDDFKYDEEVNLEFLSDDSEYEEIKRPERKQLL